MNGWMVSRRVKSIVTDDWVRLIDHHSPSCLVGGRRGGGVGVACGTRADLGEPVAPDSEDCSALD